MLFLLLTIGLILTKDYLLSFAASAMFDNEAEIQSFYSRELSKPVTQSILSFCTGENFACSVFENKSLRCWGHKMSFGQEENGLIGVYDNSFGDSLEFIDVGSTSKAVKVQCGSQHICVRLASGDMKCMGNNKYGQTGNGLKVNTVGEVSNHTGNNLPVINIGTSLKVLDIALGRIHSCVKVSGSKVKCYGDNQYGQLGFSTYNSSVYADEAYSPVGLSLSQMGNNLPFIDFGEGVEVETVHSGPTAHHSCIILSNPTFLAQRIKCWGYGRFGQLGYGRFKTEGEENDEYHEFANRGDNHGEMGNNLTCVDLGTESRVKQVAIGGYHTCALLVNSNLKCFGLGSDGQLASGSTSILSTLGEALPTVAIDDGKAIMFLSVGFYHTCVVYDDFKVMKCVGFNNDGQLGQGDKTTRGNSFPTIYPNIPAIDLGEETLNISSIYSGGSFNCVIFDDQSVKCFGSNADGQCAVGTGPYIGDASGEMGASLKFAMLFSPTTSPTLPTHSPSISPSLPTRSPSNKPTGKPTLPTSSPTKQCDYKTSKLCKSDPNCIWSGDGKKKQCSVLECILFNKKQCKKQKKICKWAGSACVPL